MDQRRRTSSTVRVVAREHAGFTLLELLVTVSVAAVFLTIGVPGFVQFIQNNRATAHANDLVMALNLARSEALQRGEPVVVCRSADGASCAAGADWSTGWIVQTDDAELVRTWPARSGGDADLLTSDVDEVRFEPRGSISAAGAEFEVRLPRCTGEQARTIRVNVAGRVSVTRVAC